MILSQPNLRRAVKRGEIVFDPSIEEDQWGQASVDLRLGFSFTRLRKLPGITLSVAEGLPPLLGFWDTVELKPADQFGKPEAFDLEPGGFVLAMTYESIRVPPNMVALIEGRSTYARVGLSMHQTAPWIQPGWSGPIVLEIMNSGPITIRLTPVIDRPCQLSFFRLTSALPRHLTYGSRPSEFYANQRHPLRHDRSQRREEPRQPRRADARRRREAGPRTRRRR